MKKHVIVWVSVIVVLFAGYGFIDEETMNSILDLIRTGEAK